MSSRRMDVIAHVLAVGLGRSGEQKGVPAQAGLCGGSGGVQRAALNLVTSQQQVDFVLQAHAVAQGQHGLQRLRTHGARQETLELTAKESELNWRYREISATFPQIGIDNETLRRLTTRHGELLKQQRLPDAAYRLIGKALDQSPAIQLEALDWRLGEAIGPATSGNRNISVLNGGDEIITVRGIVRLEAGATPRQILATLEQFMQFLRVDRNNEVKVIQQPFDIESSQALRGGDKDDENTQPRQFTLQVARRTAP